MNNMKTFMLLAGMTALLVFIGGALGGRAGLMIALVFAVVMNLGSYWFSDKIILKMFDAKEVHAGDDFGLYEIVQKLAKRANLPMPKVYLVNNDAPNAFATGRNPDNAAVAATTGLLRSLSKDEVSGVMAHELGHVMHRDTLISAVTATIAGAISGIATMFMWLSMFGGNRDNVNPIVGILLMILAPIAASVIQMAISRSREYEADKAGAELCGNPNYLADALLKLERKSHEGVFENAEKHPAAAHLFIVNPLSGKKLASLFSTHPVTEERVKRLRAMPRTGSVK
jgi:heat shock protein HtpX